MSVLSRLPSFSDPLVRIVLMFALTQFLGVACGLLLLSSAQTNPDVQALSVAPTGQAEDWLNGLFFVGYVLFGALVAIFIIRFIKRRIAFRLLEFAMLSGSVSVVALALLNGALGMEFFTAIGLSAVLGLAFAALKFFTKGLKNAAAILSSAGVAALFGFSMGFWPALLFVIGLSLYDYIAVFKTRHMLQLAEHLGDRELSFTITAEKKEKSENRPPILPNPFASKTSHLAPRFPSSAASSSDFFPSHAAASSRPPAPSPAPAPSYSSGVERLDLGSGDLAVPAMLAVSASTLAGPEGALAVASGSTLAIFLTLRFVLDKRVALPALPPICLGGLGALLALLLGRTIAGF